jgi:hypothetical protein
MNRWGWSLSGLFVLLLVLSMARVESLNTRIRALEGDRSTPAKEWHLESESGNLAPDHVAYVAKRLREKSLPVLSGDGMTRQVRAYNEARFQGKSAAEATAAAAGVK